MTTLTAPSSASTPAEFSVNRTWQSDRRGPARWILSYALRNKLFILGMFIGALGNGIGAGVVPRFVGRGFDIIIATGDLKALGTIALLLVLSQVIRALLMLGRNFCSEVIGQRVEKEARDEIYLSLIGKSMSFHDKHSTGELMARATNDMREINLMFNPGVNLVVGSINFMVAPFVLVPGIHPQLLLTPSIYIMFIFFFCETISLTCARPPKRSAGSSAI
jgi:ATP-binding cassette subfamily B protein